MDLAQLEVGSVSLACCSTWDYEHKGIGIKVNTFLALFTFAMHCLPSTGVLFKRRIIFAYGLRLARLITTGRWSKCAQHVLRQQQKAMKAQWFSLREVQVVLTCWHLSATTPTVLFISESPRPYLCSKFALQHVLTDVKNADMLFFKYSVNRYQGWFKINKPLPN